MAKDRTASNMSSSKKKKRARHLLSGPSAAAMKSSKQPEKPNPFDSIWSRRKFDTLGKRRKGEERRVGQSRSLAIEKRRKTLQKEYEQSSKSSTFLDKRIGETDDTLPEYVKGLLRQQRERRLKFKRPSKYNLSDGEEDDSAIHQANSLSAMDDFDDEVPPDDDDDAFMGTENGSDPTNFLNFHGANRSESNLLDGKENSHKTKKQVMLEIISKSKHYKAQKAKDKDEDDHLMEKLDKEFTSMAQTEALLSLTQPSKMNALKALLNKNNTRQSREEGPPGRTASAEKQSFEKEKPDAYDKLVKEMVMDIRARPSDRTKTAEEVAQEERERLELLEEERQKRMLATDGTDSSDEGSDDDGEDIQKSDAKKFKSISGDDLGDSFSIDDDIETKKGWVDDIYDKENQEDSDEDGTSSEGSESEHGHEASDGDSDSGGDEAGGNKHEKMSVKVWEQSDDDGDDMDGEEIDGSNEKEMDVNDALTTDIGKKDSLDSHKMAAGKLPSMKQVALPFVIDAPKDLSELCLLLDNCSDTEVAEAISRIRACNSIRLAAENRKKMQVFYGVLLQYFAVLPTRRPLNIKIINSLVKHLVEMSVETPYFAAICARQRLIHIRTRFCEDIKIPEKSSWPSLKTLVLLRLWSLIFPCSDFRHVVMTPAILMMCEYLMRCPIVSARDTAIGTFLCSMVLSVTEQSRKFCPEAVTFLHTLLLSSIEPEAGLQQNSQRYHLLELKTPNPWLHIHNDVQDVNPIDFFKMMDMPPESKFFDSDNFKTSVLVSVIETLKGFINIYEGLSSFSETFLPFSSLIHQGLQNLKLPDLLRGKMVEVVDLIKKKASDHLTLRQPLQIRKQKPVPIRLLNPKFEENFVKGRDYDPDRERAERKKLKKQLKKEARGAVRELRKDNNFITQLKEKKRLLEEEERAEKFGKARAFLQEQEHAFKSGQLGKGRKRRK